MKKIEAEKLAKDWEKKGFSCDLWTDPPGKRWENYIHETDELLAVAEGTLEVEISGKKKTLRSGDEVFIPARATHSVRNIGSSTAHWYYGYKK